MNSSCTSNFKCQEYEIPSPIIGVRWLSHGVVRGTTKVERRRDKLSIWFGIIDCRLSSPSSTTPSNGRWVILTRHTLCIREWVAMYTWWIQCPIPRSKNSYSRTNDDLAENTICSVAPKIRSREFTRWSHNGREWICDYLLSKIDYLWIHPAILDRTWKQITAPVWPMQIYSDTHKIKIQLMRDVRWMKRVFFSSVKCRKITVHPTICREWRRNEYIHTSSASTETNAKRAAHMLVGPLRLIVKIWEFDFLIATVETVQDWCRSWKFEPTPSHIQL